MKGVKRVYSAHAIRAKELDRETIETAVHAIIAAEFAVAISKYASAFESYELLQEHITLSPPL